VWLVGILIINIWIWNGLKKFQANYEQDLENNGSLSVSQTVGQTDDAGQRAAPEEITLSFDRTEEQPSVSTVENLNGIQIIAYSNMQILSGGKKAGAAELEELSEPLLDDYSELTGNVVKKCIYVVDADDLSQISVLDRNGKTVTADGNDYTKGVYETNEELKKAAVSQFEVYLKHISKMVTLDEVKSVMQTSSKAYKAVSNSQKSLEWMITAKQMTFSKEDVENLLLLDDNHMMCDLHIDLTKVTENDRTVSESVHYQVLFEKVSGVWMIYSFYIIA
jgi:hypothetical protein